MYGGGGGEGACVLRAYDFSCACLICLSCGCSTLQKLLLVKAKAASSSAAAAPSAPPPAAEAAAPSGPSRGEGCSKRGADALSSEARGSRRPRASQQQPMDVDGDSQPGVVAAAAAVAAGGGAEPTAVAAGGGVESTAAAAGGGAEPTAVGGGRWSPLQ